MPRSLGGVRCWVGALLVPGEVRRGHWLPPFTTKSPEEPPRAPDPGLRAQPREQRGSKAGLAHRPTQQGKFGPIFGAGAGRLCPQRLWNGRGRRMFSLPVPRPASRWPFPPITDLPFQGQRWQRAQGACGRARFNSPSTKYGPPEPSQGSRLCRARKSKSTAGHGPKSSQ